MIEEQLFEINQRIAQIRRNLQKRNQKVRQWSVPYQHILAQKKQKGYYLQKQSKTQQQFNKIKQQSVDQQKKQEQINHIIKQSRKKIYQYSNQLKELDQLLKKKNKFRSKKDNNCIFQQQNKFKNKQQKGQRINDQKKQLTNNSTLSKNVKQRLSPFQSLKIERLLQFYEQIKNDTSQAKFPGLGLNSISQNLFHRQNKEEKIKNVQKKQGTKIWLTKRFNSAFKQNYKTLSYTHTSNFFQNRMKKIIQYHGQFWQKDFNLL